MGKGRKPYMGEHLQNGLFLCTLAIGLLPEGQILVGCQIGIEEGGVSEIAYARVFPSKDD